MTTPTAGVRQATASGTSYLELTMDDTTEACVRGMQSIVAHDEGVELGHVHGAVTESPLQTIMLRRTAEHAWSSCVDLGGGLVLPTCSST